MAVPLKLLERGESQIIALASNDISVLPGSTTSDFRIKLPVTLQFPGGGEDWIVCLCDAVFDHPGNTAVYVSTNIIQGRIDGSQQTDVIARLPSVSVATQSYAWEVVTSLPQWIPLARKDVSEIEIQLTDKTGALLPVGVNPTTVTLMIRRATLR
nr:hypothetical protein [Nitrosomonas nitrosa]